MNVMDALEIRDTICSEMNYWQESWLPTKGEEGLVTGMLAKAIAPLNPAGGVDAARHRLLAFLFGEYMGKKDVAISSHTLPSECWFALVKWVKPYKDEVDGWVSDNPDFETDAMFLSTYIDAQCARKEKEILNGLGF